jgi:hypothetical protein
MPFGFGHSASSNVQNFDSQAPGVAGKIYVDSTTNKIMLWNTTSQTYDAFVPGGSSSGQSSGAGILHVGTSSALPTSGVMQDELRYVEDVNKFMAANIVGGVVSWQDTGITYTDLDNRYPTKTSADATYAPITHTHTAGDIISLNDTLLGKANVNHTHAIADVTGLSNALSNKQDALANASQVAKIGEDGSGKLTYNGSAVGGGTSGATVNDADASSTTTVFSAKHTSDLLAGKSDTGHQHVIGDVSGLQIALDNKQGTLSNATQLAKIGEDGSGKLTYNGASVGGTSGATVNDADATSTTTVFSAKHTSDLLAGKQATLSNATQVAKIGEDGTGKMTYNGSVVGGGTSGATIDDTNLSSTTTVLSASKTNTLVSAKQDVLSNASTTLSKLTNNSSVSTADIGNIHTHSNATQLAKISEIGGAFAYNGSVVGSPVRTSTLVTVAAGNAVNIASGKDKLITPYLVTGVSTQRNMNQATDTTKAFASRILNASYNQTKAFDSNDSTYYQAGSGAGDWNIGYDFGAGYEQAIGYVRILFNGTAATTQPQTLAVEYSDDGTNYTQAITNDKVASTTDYGFYSPNVGKHRYWRIRSVTTDATAPMIKTIEFWDAVWIEGKKIIVDSDKIQVNYDDNNITVVNNGTVSQQVRIVQM